MSDELREFSELAQVTFRDLLRLDQLRLDIAADADVWLQTLHAEAGRADFRIATAL